MEEKEKVILLEKHSSDLRVFVIALLTSVIVVALYHFGTGVCRIMCPKAPPACPVMGRMPNNCYMLVPCMPQQRPMAPQWQGRRHHHGERMMPQGPNFKGKRQEFRGHCPDMRGPRGHFGPEDPAFEGRPAPAPVCKAKPCPDKPAPAPVCKAAPCPDKPAPAPVPAPAK